MDNDKIGARLKAARKAAGYKTALAFCEKFDIPKSTYSQHELGDRTLKDKILKKYAENLGVNFHWLKTGDGNPLSMTSDINQPHLENNLQQSELVDEILNRRYAINSIDEVLLAELLKELIERGKTKDLNAEQIAHAVTGLYNSLKKSVVDPQSIQQMVRVAVETYFQFYSEKIMDK